MQRGGKGRERKHAIVGGREESEKRNGDQRSSPSRLSRILCVLHELVGLVVLVVLRQRLSVCPARDILGVGDVEEDLGSV